MRYVKLISFVSVHPIIPMAHWDARLCISFTFGPLSSHCHVWILLKRHPVACHSQFVETSHRSQELVHRCIGSVWLFSLQFYITPDAVVNFGRPLAPGIADKHFVSTGEIGTGKNEDLFDLFFYLFMGCLTLVKKDGLKANRIYDLEENVLCVGCCLGVTFKFLSLSLFLQ